MVSVLSGLILEKIYELFFRRDQRNCPLYTDVRGAGFLCLRMGNHKNLQHLKYFINQKTRMNHNRQVPTIGTKEQILP